jgi:F-type H+-transporting ATPase subunit b
VAFRRIGATLEDRRARIEQGLRDADAARVDRDKAAQERQQVLAEARREANEILTRAQRTSDETRERELGETRAELERLREQAVAEIDAERQRAVSDVRAQVADLALLAAGKVVGETMNTARERRLVDEFLDDVGGRGSAAHN